MTNNNSIESMFLEHMKTFPKTLDNSLLQASKLNGGVKFHDGDFSLNIRSVSYFQNEDIIPDYNGSQVIILSTPNIIFAYHPETGDEIGNTMKRHNETKREAILPHLASVINMKLVYLKEQYKKS